MRYISTRGGASPQGFTDILLEGLAADGGLYVPETYPALNEDRLAALRALSYPALAFEILSLYADDLPAEDLRAMLGRVYNARVFGSEEVTPVRTLEPGLHLLRLSNGPTLAFKDVAMQLLGQLFEYVLARRGGALNILGATSGDTGSSAEHAMRGKARIRVFMLSPHRRMSPFQAAQMYALDEPNIFNIAIRGVFDDCQDIVKALGGDLEFKAACRIGAVNSINWARIAAQIVYYFKAYFAVAREVGEPLAFAVPTGNFGNVLAGYIARRMGLPVGRLILATNENDVLDEFFRTGRYRVRAASQVHATSSPSMDISKASNFERYVFDLTDRDGAALRSLWEGVDQRGLLDLSGGDHRRRIQATGLVSGASSHAERLATIRRIWNDHGVMVDTHTADGIKVGLERRPQGMPLVCLETAQPAKFAATIREALGRDPERPPGYEGLEARPQRFDLLEADAQAVKAFIRARAG
ncbi:MAG: threonine synthase [Burkholderiales bacterium]|nr:threonine synthase [Burkholderiales bacterium]